MIPILNLTMLDRVVKTVRSIISSPPGMITDDSLGIGNGLVTDVEVQILDTPLTGKMTWFTSYWRWCPSAS